MPVVELKICECCGGMFTRADGKTVYCRGCTARLAQLPPPTLRKVAVGA